MKDNYIDHDSDDWVSPFEYYVLGIRDLNDPSKDVISWETQKKRFEAIKNGKDWRDIGETE